MSLAAEKMIWEGVREVHRIGQRLLDDGDCSIASLHTLYCQERRRHSWRATNKAAIMARPPDYRSHSGDLAVLVIGWYQMLRGSGSYSKGLGFAATAGHTVERPRQENVKTVVLACAENWIA